MHLRFAPRFLAALPLAVLTSSMCPNAVAQQIADSVHTLDIEAGKRTIDVKAGTLKPRGERRASEAQVGIAYGINRSWRMKLTAEYERGQGEGTRLDTVEWENRFRLPVDVAMLPTLGFLTELEWAKDRDDGYRVKFGPLMQATSGKTQWNLNVLFERFLGETPSRATEISYQWQAKVDWKENFQFGLQGFGEMGEWDDWAPRDEQSHRLGPAVFGTIPLGNGEKLGYNAAYLGDYSAGTRSNGFRLQVEYEF